ncbi:MAG: hypothetical protein QOG72_1228 [Sphingomonadales bacterium]|jgi:hypothetical protein|nr:hypothetical protein [Sphingomonadales bacterium]
MIKTAILAAACALPLSACATTSFAPPGVRVEYKDRTDSSASCAQTADRAVDRVVKVWHDVDGALDIVDAYIVAYDCAARQAADGRQLFEVPGFLTATGAAVAAALGAGPNLAILATGAGSAFNAGKAYYDPKEKATIYSHSLDALRCVRSEAMGVDNFAMFKSESDAERVTAMAAPGAGPPPNPTVSVSAHQQYFVMVTNAVGSVSGILADRLSSVGSKFDPAGTQAELEKLLAEIKAKQDKKDAKDVAGPTPQMMFDPSGRPFMGLSAQAVEEHEDEMVDIDLKLLQPKLQACVWRAKV